MEADAQVLQHSAPEALRVAAGGLLQQGQVAAGVACALRQEGEVALYVCSSMVTAVTGSMGLCLHSNTALVLGAACWLQWLAGEAWWLG